MAYRKSIANLEPDEYGVYELDSFYEIIYIGHGKIQSSLMKHFEDSKHPIAGACLFSAYLDCRRIRIKMERENLPIQNTENIPSLTR